MQRLTSKVLGAPTVQLSSSCRKHAFSLSLYTEANVLHSGNVAHMNAALPSKGPAATERYAKARLNPCQFTPPRNQ